MLPKTLSHLLLDHFKYFFETDRNAHLHNEDSFLTAMPAQLYKAIVVGYVYDDVFSDFRKFFRPELYLETTLLEELTVGLKPRFIQGSFRSEVDYEQQSLRSLIYKEGEEVQEMFFIQ